MSRQLSLLAFLASQSDALILVARHRSNQPSIQPNPTYSSEALKPMMDRMKDRKSFKNSDNAMEQELPLQKGLLQKKAKTKTKTKTKTKNEKYPT